MPSGAVWMVRFAGCFTDSCSLSNLESISFAPFNRTLGSYSHGLPPNGSGLNKCFRKKQQKVREMEVGMLEPEPQLLEVLCIFS